MTLLASYKQQMSYHAVKVGDGGILVGIGVEQHLGVGMDGYVRFDALLVLAQELGNSLDFRFRLWKGTTVRVVTGMEGGALICEKNRALLCNHVRTHYVKDPDAQITCLLIYTVAHTNSDATKTQPTLMQIIKVAL